MQIQHPFDLIGHRAALQDATPKALSIFTRMTLLQA